MSNKVFGIVIGAIAIAVIGAALLLSDKTAAPSQDSNGDIASVLERNEHDYVKGFAADEEIPEPVVQIVEYGDFQCPACAAVYPVVKEAVDNYEDDSRIQFIFRHFPLTAIHQNAMTAHRAAEAAGMQGQFYAMHDVLYENMPVWSQGEDANNIIRGLAEQIGLDMSRFDDDFRNSETLSTVNAQLNTGENVGVTGTPTFFINGTRVEQNPRTAAELISLIDAELNQVEATEPNPDSSESQ